MTARKFDIDTVRHLLQLSMLCEQLLAFICQRKTYVVRRAGENRRAGHYLTVNADPDTSGDTAARWIKTARVHNFSDSTRAQ